MQEVAPSGSGKRTANVSSNPSGADVAVHGEFAGNSPSVRKISPGKHTLTVKLLGIRTGRGKSAFRLDQNYSLLQRWRK